jgi:hypothetical protein
MTNFLSRRTLLRGAGVALTLPWMESLLPKSALAADATSPIRYMPIFIPNGAPDFWIPNGSTASWTLGSILEPLADVKSKITVLKNLENGSAFNKDGSSSVEPSHGRQPGAWLTCVDAETVKARLGTSMEANGVSVDQIMAAHAVFAGKTALPSLQLGLSTVHSNCDSKQCSNSRSISWKTETQPMYKKVDPLAAFNIISAAAVPSTGTDPAAQAKRIALKKSVLDGVLENATSTRARLSVADQKRMDEFLDSVRAVELKATQVSEGMGGIACTISTKPTMATVTEDGIRQTTAKYNKGDHADAMNALIVMALQCDVTRIITYMLEDERSEFVYDNVPKRTFNANTSTAANGTCPEWHTGGQHGSPDDFASIVRWNVGKVADLAKKLDAITEANGKTLLDNTVIYFGAAMHGSDHQCDRLPALLIGSAGGKLKSNQYITLNKRPVRDLHFTMMNSVFGMGQTNFGANLTGAPISVINEIVA